MGSFRVLDSGERKEYDSGLRRDTTEGKPDYTLIPRFLFPRWAQHMLLGAVKYGRENWKKAGGSPESAQEELERFQSSALRHMFQWIDGDTDEDHACAVMFNVSVAEYIADRIKRDDFEQDALYEIAKKFLSEPWTPETSESARIFADWREPEEVTEHVVGYSRKVTAETVEDRLDGKLVRFHEECPADFAVKLTNLTACGPGDCNDAS